MELDTIFNAVVDSVEDILSDIRSNDVTAKKNLDLIKYRVVELVDEYKEPWDLLCETDWMKLAEMLYSHLQDLRNEDSDDTNYLPDALYDRSICR